MQKLDINKIRADFPILKNLFYDKPLVYLDNAATTQLPQVVLDAVIHHYTYAKANIHRGLYALAELADAAFTKAREKVRQFINAKEAQEIIFVNGTTAAINLVAQSYGHAFLKSNDTVLVSVMEHHSNIVPWQLLQDQIGIKILPIAITQNGELDLQNYTRLLEQKPKLVALTHVSNVLGTINPIKQIIAMAHNLDIPVLVDGAQAVAHFPVDVQNLDCDFYAFSGHKMYASDGIGVLYGKSKLLAKMPPYQGGGGMIKAVSFSGTKYADLPEKFEAGTPNIAGTVSLGSAIDYLQNKNLTAIFQHEKELLDYAQNALHQIPGLRIIGEANAKIGVISFVLDRAHSHDVGTILDRDGIAVRTGHHCTMPLHTFFKVPATTRVSLGIYNTRKEIDILINSIMKAERFMSNG